MRTVVFLLACQSNALSWIRVVSVFLKSGWSCAVMDDVVVLKCLWHKNAKTWHNYAVQDLCPIKTTAYCSKEWLVSRECLGPSPFCLLASENHVFDSFISVVRTTWRRNCVFPLGKFLTLPLKPHIYHLRSRTVLKTPLMSEQDVRFDPWCLHFSNLRSLIWLALTDHLLFLLKGSWIVA